MTKYLQGQKVKKYKKKKKTFSTQKRLVFTCYRTSNFGAEARRSYFFRDFSLKTFMVYTRCRANQLLVNLGLEKVLNIEFHNAT